MAQTPGGSLDADPGHTADLTLVMAALPGCSRDADADAWAAAGDNAPGEFTFVGASMIVLAAAVCLCILPAQIRDHCRRSDEPAVDDNEWPDWGKNPKASPAAVKPDPEKPVQSL